MEPFKTAYFFLGVSRPLQRAIFGDSELRRVSWKVLGPSWGCLGAIFGDSGIQRFGGSEMRGFGDSEIRRFRDSDSGQNVLTLSCRGAGSGERF